MGYNWRHKKNTTQRGYGAAWRKRRERILKRDNYLCQPCKRKGKVEAAREVDHIIEKHNGGTDDDENLQSICIPCHRAKTARRGTAVKQDPSWDEWTEEALRN